VLTARIAWRLEPARASDVAAKLPTMFIADAATHIDPRRAGALIAGLPPARIAEVTRELAHRGEFATIGRLAGQLGTESTVAALDAMDATTALQAEAAEQPRRRVARSLAAAALLALVAATSVVMRTADEGGATHSKQPAISGHAIARRSPAYQTVRSGDTFTQISEKTGLTITQLEAFNPNTDPEALVPGQRLNLRPQPPAPQRPRPMFLTVRSGESFASIAAKAGINLATLEQLNPRLRPATLQPGDRLRLRE
jgi:LysM repeat protein